LLLFSNFMKKNMRKVIIFVLVIFCLGANSQDTTKISNDSLDFELILAAETGNDSLVFDLLNKGASPNSKTYENISALMYAAQNGHYKVVKRLVANGANIDEVPYMYGETALMTAVKNNHDTIAEFLIKKGANINTKDSYDATPLIYSVAYGYYVMTDMLLYYKADVAARDREGNDALIIASFYGYKELAELLLKYKADPNTKDFSGNTALLAASQNGNIDIVKMLIEKGAKTDCLSLSGSTAMSSAIRNGHTDVVKILLENGEDKNKMQNLTGKPLELAQMSNQKETASYLKSIGANNTFLPRFKTYSISYGYQFNINDFMFDFRFGALDSRFKLDVEAGYATRLWSSKILREITPSSSYQLLERRSLLFLTIDKRFSFYQSDKTQTGFYAGVAGTFTYGRYRGLEEKVDQELLASPVLGFYTMNNWVGVKMFYEYMKFYNNSCSPNRIGILLNFFINNKAKTPENKEISWL